MSCNSHGWSTAVMISVTLSINQVLRAKESVSVLQLVTRKQKPCWGSACLWWWRRCEGWALLTTGCTNLEADLWAQPVFRADGNWEHVTVNGWQAIKREVVLTQAKSKCLPVVPWAKQECGQVTFPHSISRTRQLLLGCQRQNWTGLDVESSLLALDALKHAQDVSSRSVGQFSVW